MYTIGEFSRLTRISARMLRHYDAIGLFQPEQVGAENGYRYYSASQLEQLRRIEALKGYGFPLGEIRELLLLPPLQLMGRIREQHSRVASQIAQLQGALRRMEHDLETEGICMKEYHVIMMETPAHRVFSLRRTISINGPEIHQLFQDLKEAAAKRGFKQAGAFQLVYYGDAYHPEQMEVDAQVPVTSAGPGVLEIPAQVCAAVTHIGPMEEVHEAYQAVCRWLEQHPEYHLTGTSIERYIKDETAVQSLQELETGILFPVTRV